MKKLFAVLMVVLLLSTFAAGCGSDPVQKEPEVKATAAPETEAAATAAPETTAPPTEPEDPMLGRWIGIYMDMEGLKVPMGRDQGMAIDFLLEADGKITYFLYVESDGEGEEAEVAADWTGEESSFQIHSDSDDMPGTYSCSITEGILEVKDLLGEGTSLKMAKEGSPQIDQLREEAQLMQDILDAIDAETAETAAP